MKLPSLSQHLKIAMTVLMLGTQVDLGHYRAEFLQSHGIGVRVVFPESKAAALSAIRGGNFDAAILSYTLPNEIAKELVELIDQVCPDCPLIAITRQRWEDREFKPDETVLDTDPPQTLLEVLARISKRNQNPRSGSGIRRIK